MRVECFGCIVAAVLLLTPLVVVRIVQKRSRSVFRKIQKNRKHEVDPKLLEQLGAGRLLACLSSRPGQCGRADGYILEGAELEFYQRQLNKKKGKKA